MSKNNKNHSRHLWSAYLISSSVLLPHVHIISISMQGVGQPLCIACTAALPCVLSLWHLKRRNLSSSEPNMVICSSSFPHVPCSRGVSVLYTNFLEDFRERWSLLWRTSWLPSIFFSVMLVWTVAAWSWEPSHTHEVLRMTLANVLRTTEWKGRKSLSSW